MAAKPHYRVVTVRQEPFSMYDKSIGSWTGFCIDLLEDISNILNFTYEITGSRDGHFGSLNFTTMEWNGMIRELLNGSVDMAFAPMWMTRVRRTAVDFTEPFYKMNGISILMKFNQKEVSFFRFLTILELNVWLSFLGVFLLTSILLYFLEWFSPYSYTNTHKKHENEPSGRFHYLKECFWYTLTSIIGGESEEMPKNLSGKLCTVTWWLFAFIITAAYTANFGAYQTSLRMEGHVESLKDLIRQYKIEYSTVYNSPTYHYFVGMAQAEQVFYDRWESMCLNESMPSWEKMKLTVWKYPFDDIYTKMLSSMTATGFPGSIKEAVTWVREEGPIHPFAFVGEEDVIDYLVLTNCDLISVGRPVARKPYAIALPRGSLLKNKLNFAIRKLYTKGRIEELITKWWEKNPARILCGYVPGLNDGIGTNYMAAVFSLILLGILLSFGILCIEYWCYYYIPRAVLKNSKRLIAIRNVIDGKIDLVRN